MKAREMACRGLRVGVLASVLAAVLIGGISVALDLERSILSATPRTEDDSTGVHDWSGGFRLRGMGFCGGTPMPRFEYGAFVVGPLLFLMALPAPRTIELRLLG